MKALRFILWFSLLFAVLLIGAAFLVKSKLPEIINHYLVGTLQPYGLTSFDSGEPYLGLMGAGSKQIEFTGRYDNIQYKVQLLDVQARYELAALKGGQVHSIHVDKLLAEVDIQPAQSEGEPVEVIDIAFIQAQLASIKLPLDFLTLKQIELQLRHPACLCVITGQGVSLDAAKQQLLGSFSLLAEKPLLADVHKLDFSFEHSAIAWLPNVHVSSESETIAQQIKLTWQQAESGLLVMLSGDAALPNAKVFMSRIGVSLSELLESPLLEIALDVAVDGQLTVPEKLSLTADELIRQLAVSAQIDTGIRVAKPNGGNLLLSVDANTSLLAGSDKWQVQGEFVQDDWQVSGVFDGHYQTLETSELKLSAQLASLPVLAKGLSEFGISLADLQLVSGAGQLDVSATQGFNHYSIDTNLTDLEGLYDGLAFTGLSLNAPLVKAKHWQSSDIRIFAKSVSSGVTLDSLDIVLRLLKTDDFTQSSWQLKQFSTSLFGGDVRLSSPTSFDFPFSGNTFDLSLSNLHMDNLLALYAEQGLSGSGVLNGSLPITINQDSVSINSGGLATSVPGKISYRSDLSKTVDNEQLAMTLRLLEDFNYDSLNIGVNFEPDGKLMLKTALSGRNPAEFDGRQVNFNINVEENLYDLFKVLKLTDTLTKSLEERLTK